jgi:hypothetical protein
MAEEKRSINIAYKADLKDLIAKLKQMPNVTEAEARKMVAALDRQLKQAEKASKKAADASKKAAQNAANAARRGAKDFDDLADSARRAEERLERVAESSGDIDRGFSSVGLALRGVNPQVAEAADGLADMFAVVEGLTMSVTALNPVVVAAGVAIGALTLGYVAHQAELEKAKQLTLDLKDAQEALATSQLEQEDNLVDAGAKVRDLQRDYKLLTGQISQYEYDLEKAGDAAEVAFLGNIKFAKEAAKEADNNVKMIETLLGNYTKLGKAPLSDAEIERLRQLQLQNDLISNNLDLTSKQNGVHAALMILQKSLTAEAAEQNLNVKKVTVAQEEAIRLAKEMVTLENELAEATEEASNQSSKRADSDERAVDAKEKYNKLMEEALEMGDDQIKEFDLQKKMDKELANAFISEEGRKQLAAKERIEDQIADIEMLGIATGREAEAAMAIESLRHDQKIENLDIEKEKEEDLQKLREEAAMKNLESMMEFGSVAMELGENLIKNSQLEIDMNDKKQEELSKMSDIEREAYEKKRKQLRALFVFQKGMSMAEVAMKTAEAIIAAQKLIPPFSFIQMGIATGIGAAQMGVVMSQQMPSFHMGGLAQDEATARVLKGEAVLDRATVRRIGGEQGVRNLQQGGSNGSQTVVIQPFKHFGRFAKDLGISSPKLQGIRGY